MADVVVVGAGACGLATALLLARDGHDVTVLERDAEPPPDSVEAAWAAWRRKGVVQFRQPHFLQARVRRFLDAELPDVRDALLAAGAVRVDPLDRMPAAIADRERRPGDERFASITARRVTTELVLARAAESEPGVSVRRGVDVTDLLARRRDGIPHVHGLRTRGGGEIASDLVVDATGRSSPLPRWMNEVGAPPVEEEAEDSGFTYYTRYFRSTNGSLPTPRTPGLLTPLGSFSIITLPGDTQTWSVTLYISARDRPLKRLRFPEAWTAALAACPLHRHWLDGDPITDVLPMAGVLDRRRRLAAGGRPTVTGVVAVADAWACTNPSLARGLALGLDHAARLRDVLRSHGDAPRDLATAWDATTEAEFTPWYRATVATDRARLAEIRTLTNGTPLPHPDTPEAAVRARFPIAAGRDADVFRAFMEVVGCLTLPAEAFARPGLVERILAVTEGLEPPPPPGPSRVELLELLDRVSPR